MNVLNFEDKVCERNRALLDSLLNGELPGESEAGLFAHLDQCARCAEALDGMQRVQRALKQAVERQDEAPAELQTRVRSRIHARPRPYVPWLAIAASLLLSFGALGFWRWQHQEIAMNALARAEIMRIGVNDHVHCALGGDYSAGPHADEQNARELGPEFAGLARDVQPHLSNGYVLMTGHQCTYQGRAYVHLVMMKGPSIVSVILTRKNGEPFPAGAPALLDRYENQEVVGFASRDYLAYVISGLPQEEHRQLANTLVPSVRGFLAQREG